MPEPVEIYPGQPGAALFEADNGADWDVTCNFFQDVAQTVPFNFIAGDALTLKVMAGQSRTDAMLITVGVTIHTGSNAADFDIPLATIQAIDPGDYYAKMYFTRAGKTRPLMKGTFKIYS